MRLLALAILGCALAGAASAETRIITEPLRPNAGNNVAVFTEHTNGTAYFEPGGVGSAPRQDDIDFYIYQHGIDITDPTVTVSGGGGVTAEKVGSFKGPANSRVMLPIGLGDLQTAAGGLIIRVNVNRSVALTTQRTIKVAHISGDVVFDLKFTCKSNESSARLTTAKLDKTGFAAGAQARLDLTLDLPAQCDGQRVTIQLPPCLEMANPVGTGRVSGFDGRWEAYDPKTLAFTLYGRDTCAYRNGVNRGVLGYDRPGDVKVTMGSVTKTLAINYRLPPLSTTITPANPGPTLPSPQP